MEVLDLPTHSWIRPATHGTAPLPRNAHTMTVVGTTKLILFGGHSHSSGSSSSGSGGTHSLVDVFEFDTNTLTWTELEIVGTPPTVVRGHTGTLMGQSSIYFFGGWDGQRRSRHVHAMNLVDRQWISFPEAETPEGPSPRQRHSACALDRHRILILGGFDGETWMSDAYALHICGLDHPGLSENAKRELFIDMEELWKSSSFSDVTLVTATAEIAAHRCILAARCPYFRSMFVSHMKEANEMRVELQCPWSADAMRAFVRFLYTAHVDSELSPLVKCELLGVADEFAVDALKALAETLLVNEIDAHSAPRLLTNAELYASTKLKAACLDFLISNPDSSVLERASAELVHQPNLMKEIILLQSTRRSNSR
eukprot:GHVU01144032.1.p1 GENE.GHVU01144032.1~~GHVU01144032.1.p1  ORF type:complete len:369 (+),score=78.19 GHVU01144032.1:421-1527(+)